MSSERIEAVYLTTHNWGKSAKFFQALGFKLEFETDHHSGQLRSGDGPFLFIAEVPPGEKPGMQVVLKVADEQAVQPQPIVDVVTPFEDTHWGTRDMTVRDPDGRVWRLQAPASRAREAAMNEPRALPTAPPHASHWARTARRTRCATARARR